MNWCFKIMVNGNLERERERIEEDDIKSAVREGDCENVNWMQLAVDKASGKLW